MNLKLASETRKIILLWTVRYGTFESTHEEWGIIRKLIRSYGEFLNIRVDKLLRQIKTRDEIAVYWIIKTLGLDDEEISLISESAFKNGLGGSREGTKATGKVHEETEDW